MAPTSLLDQQNPTDLPSYQELDEPLYRKLVRQLEHQKSAIGLLHLQLKSRGIDDISEVIAEKDKLIMSLQSQLDENTSQPFLGNGEDSEELIKENEELSERLRHKNQEIRQVKQRYNDHLNELQKKIENYEEALSEPLQEPDTPTIGSEALQEARTKIEGLEQELDSAREQIEFFKNQSTQNREELHGLERESIESYNEQITELKEQLSEKEVLIESLRESSLTNLDSVNADDRILVENETLRNKVDLLESELNILAKTTSRESKRDASIEVLDSILDLYQGCSNLIRSEEPDSPVSILRNSVLELCKCFGLEPFDSLGEEFDPNRHHCVDAVYSVHSPHDTVFKETVPGFNKGGEIFRKANVVVSKNPVHCHNCGTEGSENSQFCAQCGTKLLLETHGEKEPIFVNDEENAHAYIELGDSYLRKREFQFAHDAYLKAHTLYPDSVHAILGLSRVYESRGDYEESLAMLDKLAACPGMVEKRKEYQNRIEKKKRILQDLQEI